MRGSEIVDGTTFGERAASTRATPSQPAQAVVSPELARGLGVLETWTRAGLTVAVVGFGVWTLVYQVALVLGIPVLATVVTALVLATAASVALVPVTTRSGRLEATAVVPRWLMGVAAAVGLVAIVAALLGHRGLAIAVIAAGAATGVVHAFLSRGGRERQPRTEVAPPEPGLWLVGWFWALACGVLAAVMARPDGDDAYFVNLAEWVADRGTFPLRDTMLSDQQFPALGSHSPPVHSIEALIGSVGWLSGLPAGTLTYVVATPVLTVLAVLALTLLISVARVPYAPLALSAAVLYLLMSGGSGASFGNFFALRMWQGKAVLATLVLPLVTAFAIEYIRRGGRRWAVLLLLGVVGTVGASNTAVFLVPVLLAGLLVAAWLVGGLRRAGGVALALLYPLACGVAVLAFAPAAAAPAAAQALRSSPPAPPLQPLLGIPGWYGLLVATFLAVTIGWLGLRSRAARAVVLCVTLAASVALLPPVTQLLASSAGVGGVIWRMWWVVPVPLLVGGAVGAAASVLHGRARPIAAIATALAMGFLPLVQGRWIGADANGARFVSPVSWKTPVGSEAEARLALSVSREGDVVLAPWDASRVLAGMSVDVHPVSARTYYLPEYASVPDVKAKERLTLQAFADSRTEPAGTLRPLVEQLGVDTACVSPRRGQAVDTLEELGFRVAAEGGDLVCLRR